MNERENCPPCETRIHQTSIRETTLDGQRAIVTGANSGIGEAIVKGLAEAGAAVVVNYVSGDDKAEQVVSEIRAAGGKAFAYKADVSNEEQVQ
ncbi:MAG: SDR family NAD(P)-dependent oxidoreductase, partial [Burkholderiales bacterium]